MTLSSILWLCVGILFAVLEGLTVQLVSIWLAAGSIAAAIAAVLHAPFLVQFAVFIAVSALLLAITRPLVQKKLKVKTTHTNADRLIGQTALVLQQINNQNAEGRVTVDGTDWAARSIQGTIIPEGARVHVRAIEGVKLLVEPVDPSAA